MGSWRELYCSTVDGGDCRFMAKIPSEGVGGRVERNVPRAKGWKGGQKASLLYQAAGGGRDEGGVGPKGGGNEVEGVADMVVHPGFGMPAAVKKMVPVGVNEPPTEARGAGVWWKKGNAMGPAEGQDEAEV